MPPIPIYKKNPINAAKADGVSPKTASPDESSKERQPSPTPTTATTTMAATGSSTYLKPQPGAVPSLPVPTGAAAGASSDGGCPPPPKPGVRTVRPGRREPATVAATTMSPPVPTAGPTRLPPQMAMAPPTLPQAQRGTSTATFQAGTGSAEHLPGY